MFSRGFKPEPDPVPPRALPQLYITKNYGSKNKKHVLETLAIYKKDDS